jgi:hypothetical protein
MQHSERVAFVLCGRSPTNSSTLFKSTRLAVAASRTPTSLWSIIASSSDSQGSVALTRPAIPPHGSGSGLALASSLSAAALVRTERRHGRLTTNIGSQKRTLERRLLPECRSLGSYPPQRGGACAATGFCSPSARSPIQLLAKRQPSDRWYTRLFLEPQCG